MQAYSNFIFNTNIRVGESWRPWQKSLSPFSFAFIILFILFPSAHVLDVNAQGTPPVLEPSGRSGEPPPVTEEKPLRPTPPPSQILPPVEELPEMKPERPPLLKVFVKKIRVIGSTVFSQEELAKVTAPYENREISTEDLQELRRALTMLYVNKGYINSGAVIPDQTLQEGVVTIQIIEGELSDITIEGTKYFFPYYFERRIVGSAGHPLNINPLRQRLQLLLQDARIERINSELKPGLKPGESVLHVRVQEALPFKARLEFNNFQSPTVGAERGLATVAHQNVLGFGDIFQFTYGRSGGIDPLLDLSYLLPITPQDTTLSVQFRRNDFQVIAAAFDPLDIESETDIWTFTLRHPVYRTLSDEIALSVIAEHLQNRVTFGGLIPPGPFRTPGTINGESVISALRLAQEWTHRASDQVLAFRSRFSIGLDVVNATNNRTGPDQPDSQFFVWLGQAQWAKRFSPTGIQLLSSLALQVSNDSLFPLEQFAVGGRFSVRGYRENQLVQDNAFLFSVEPRIPVLPSTLGPNFVTYFAPFVDVGRSWNTKVSTSTSPKTLASIGVGLRLSLFQRAHANVYWGQQLNHIPDPAPGGNLQDHGVHVQFVLDVL